MKIKMEGYMIYLLYRQMFPTNRIELIAPHATFDGVVEQLNENKKYYIDRGRDVETQSDGSFLVKDKDGNPKEYFFVSSRTILK